MDPVHKLTNKLAKDRARMVTLTIVVFGVLGLIGHKIWQASHRTIQAKCWGVNNKCAKKVPCGIGGGQYKTQAACKAGMQPGMYGCMAQGDSGTLTCGKVGDDFTGVRFADAACGEGCDQTPQ